MRNYSLYEYFYFTRVERNASITLSVLCLFFFLFPSIYPLLKSPEPIPDFKAFRLAIAPILAQRDALASKVEAKQVSFRGGSENGTNAALFLFDPNTASKEDLVSLGLSPRTAQTVLNYRKKGGQFRKVEDLKKLYTLRPEDYERLAPWVSIAVEEEREGEFFEKKKPVPVEHFHFDPNTASKEDFVRLGLSGRTAQSVVNYRSKGGKFWEKEDLKKIYTLESADYERLAPWIEIAETEPAEPSFAESGDPRPVFEKKKRELKHIDINSAGAEEWEQFRGIGPGYAKGIVRLREKLGGFVSVEQVGETYGLPDSTFQAMQEYLQLQTAVYRKLKINSASMEELKMHPYLSNSQATIIFNYRQQHGGFANFASMKKVRAGFKESDWLRLEPYLTFD